LNSLHDLTAEQRKQWLAAHGQVIHHLLGLVTRSQWNDHLVLRGSLLLKAWLGEEGREPGDIDWVVQPDSISVTDAFAKDMLGDLIHKIGKKTSIGEITLQTRKISVEKLWNYEWRRGRRIILPWKAPGLPPGTVQMDFAFSLPLYVLPSRTVIPAPGGGENIVWGASMEESLAWKLFWLQKDEIVRGKDLYDAALLAERAVLPLSLFEKVREGERWDDRTNLLEYSSLQWEVDWESFQQEYPWVTGTALDWQSRLAYALLPSFADREED